MAGGYPCDGIDLMSFIPMSDLNNQPVMNDVWGWTDPLDGKEYAICGAGLGTAFIDVSDPVNPEFLGFLPTHTSGSLWRDIKVFDNHAFIVSEAQGHGMQVFDLTRLRDVTAAPETFDEDAHYPGFGNAHNIVMNEESGYAYGVGASTFNGGLVFIDVSNPMCPEGVGGYAAEGYTHDAQVVFYHGPDEEHHCKEISINANGNQGAPVVVVDVTDKTDPQLLSASFYENQEYSHQGWLTDDHRYYLHNDELDEQNLGFNTRTHMWDMLDLDNPVYLGFQESNSSSIDHNLYVKGDYMYQSNYLSGLRILDVSDVGSTSIPEVAYFDVAPNQDAPSFIGTWSNYPYFESGTIVVSSMQDGIFILKPQDESLISSVNGDFSAICTPDAIVVEPCEPNGIVEWSKQGYTIYPNPSDGLFTLTISEQAPISLIEILDMSGRLVLSERVVSGTETTTIDASKLKTGIYLMQFDGQPSSQKLLIE